MLTKTALFDKQHLWHFKQQQSASARHADDMAAALIMRWRSPVDDASCAELVQRETPHELAHPGIGVVQLDVQNRRREASRGGVHSSWAHWQQPSSSTKCKDIRRLEMHAYVTQAVMITSHTSCINSCKAIRALAWHNHSSMANCCTQPVSHSGGSASSPPADARACCPAISNPIKNAYSRLLNIFAVLQRRRAVVTRKRRWHALHPARAGRHMNEHLLAVLP
jgi:hypothetical protein